MQLKYLIGEANKLSPLYVPLRVVAIKHHKVNGTPHNLVRQLLLTLFYDKAFLKMGQEKNMRIAYFVVINVPEDKKNTKVAIQHLLISVNISISALSTYNKRFWSY